HAPPPRCVSRRPGAKASTAAAIQRMYSNSSSRGSPGTIWELGTPLTCKTKAPSRNGSASISAVPVEISYVPIVEACAPTLEEEELLPHLPRFLPIANTEYTPITCEFWLPCQEASTHLSRRLVPLKQDMRWSASSLPCIKMPNKPGKKRADAVPWKIPRMLDASAINEASCFLSGTSQKNSKKPSLLTSLIPMPAVKPQTRACAAMRRLNLPRSCARGWPWGLMP